MATLSSVLAWEMLWTVGLPQSMAYSPWGHKELDTTQLLTNHKRSSKGERFLCHLPFASRQVFSVPSFHTKCVNPEGLQVQGNKRVFLSAVYFFTPCLAFYLKASVPGIYICPKTALTSSFAFHSHFCLTYVAHEDSPHFLASSAKQFERCVCWDLSHIQVFRRDRAFQSIYTLF